MDILPILGFVIYIVFVVAKAIGKAGKRGKAWDPGKAWNPVKGWGTGETWEAKRERAPVPLRRKNDNSGIIAKRDENIGQDTDLNPDYRKTALTEPAPAIIEEQPSTSIGILTVDNLAQGIVLSEILRPPRSLRPFSTRGRRW